MNIVGKTIVTGTLASVFIDTCMFNVEAGHRAVIFDRFRGVKPEVYGEGTHLRIPGIEKPYVIDVRTSPRIITTAEGTQTKDMQRVQLSLRVLSRPNPAALPKIYTSIGVDFAEKILPSAANEVLKAVVAQYNADQLLTLRDKVSQEIFDSLTERCQKFNLLVDDVSITHLNFSTDFSKAIEDKQVAEQNAERAKFVVLKAEQERQANVITSEGYAEAAKLMSDAYKKSGKGHLEIRRIETAVQLAHTLASAPGNVTYLPGAGQNTLLSLPASR